MPIRASRNVRQATLKLLARGLQLQNNYSASIEANQVERVLTNIDTDRCDR